MTTVCRETMSEMKETITYKENIKKARIKKQQSLNQSKRSSLRNCEEILVEMSHDDVDDEILALLEASSFEESEDIYCERCSRPPLEYD